MADNHHLKLLTDRWGGWNEWRRQNPDVRPDLSGADLERQLLIGVVAIAPNGYPTDRQ